MESRRQFMRKSTAGLSVLALGSLAGCLDSTPLGSSSSDDDAYSSWLYDPSEFLTPEFTMFMTLDIDRTLDLIEEAEGQFGDEVEDGLEEEIGQEIDDIDGVNEFDRATGIVYGTDNGAEEEMGMGVALTGSFDVDVLADEIESQDDYEEDLVEQTEYSGYELYGFSDEDGTGGFALSTDALLFGLVDGPTVDATEPLTALIDEHDSSGSSYASASESGGELIDKLEGDLSVTGIEFDTEAFDMDEPQQGMGAQQMDGLVGMGTASDVVLGNVELDAVLLYTEAEQASEAADGIESLLDVALMEAPPEAQEQLEDLDISSDGRAVRFSLSYDPEEVAEDEPGVEPGMLLLAGAFPLAIIGVFVMGIGQGITSGSGFEDDDSWA